MLAASQRARAQRTLVIFSVFNAFSFTLLTGNLISLYLLRLGAANTLIGVVASFAFVSFFFMVAGKRLVPRVGVIRLFAWAWLIRYIAILPILAAPLFVGQPREALTFLLVTVGTFGFQAARGVGIIANAPMFSGYAGTADRGRLISQFQITASIISIITGSAVAFLLGPEASLTRYVLFLATGIAAGLIATGLIFSLPELESERESARTPLIPAVREAMKQPRFSLFVRSFLLVAIASGVGRSFLIVFAKQGYALTDRAAFLLVAAGSLGNALAGYLGSVLLDRVGAKPIILFSVIVYALSLIPAIVLPPLAGTPLYVLLSIVFFLAFLGFSGAENANQAYFFGITRKDSRLNLGILYYVTLGIGGTIGSLIGGVFLDALAAFMPIQWALRLVFLGTVAILVWAATRSSRLESLGAETFRGTLEVIFSPRDLRAASLANRLVRSTSQAEECRTIRDLAQSGSVLPLHDILSRVEAPGWELRFEAMDALASLPFTPEVERVLISHLSSGEHTTASRAAWILGVRGSERSLSGLRQATTSTDRILAGRALVALARLEAPDAAGRAEEWLQSAEESPTRHYDALHAAVALQIAGSARHLPALDLHLTRGDAPDYVLDEVVFAVTRILGVYEWFYPFYAGFTRQDGRGELLSEQPDAIPPELREILRALEGAEPLPPLQKRLIALLDSTSAGPGDWPSRGTVEDAPPRDRTLYAFAAVMASRSLFDAAPAR
jgi:predicted MFS family arabinose efflux permease